MTQARSRRGDEAEVSGQSHARIRLLTSSATIFKQGLMVLIPMSLLCSSLSAENNIPAQKYSAMERMQPAHLKATHEDALRLQQKRKTLAPLPGLHDFKALVQAAAK